MTGKASEREGRPPTRSVGASAIVLALLLVFSCREPTQVTLLLTTDVPCDKWRGATVTVGSEAEVETKAPVTTTTTCNPDGSAGSLVVVPSGESDGTFAVKVVGGVERDPAECKPPFYGPGCIVARRIVEFSPHTPLAIAIALRGACSGVRCGPKDTCVSGQCRSATVPDGSACAGAKGCGEGVLKEPVSDDCATRGLPADESCWDVAAELTVAHYPRDRQNGLHVFGQRVTAGQKVYAFLDGTSDQTYSTTTGYCDYQKGTTFVFSPGWDIERRFDPKSGAVTIAVRGRSDTDCKDFRATGAAQSAGAIAVNPARGWQLAGDATVCRVTGAASATGMDHWSRPVFCDVDPGAGTTRWQSGQMCGTAAAPDCCLCPDAADVDITVGVRRD